MYIVSKIGSNAFLVYNCTHGTSHGKYLTLSQARAIARDLNRATIKLVKE